MQFKPDERAFSRAAACAGRIVVATNEKELVVLRYPQLTAIVVLLVPFWTFQPIGRMDSGFGAFINALVQESNRGR